MQFQLAKLEYQYAHFKQKMSQAQFLFLEKALQVTLKIDNFFDFLQQTQPALQKQRKEHLQQLLERPTCVFIFRTLHFIDWFIPIHHALERLYPQKYSVLYVDYASSLHRIGQGLKYCLYRQKVQERLMRFEIDPFLHFAHQELPARIKPFEVSLTCEAIRYEQLDIQHRVYLPHYCLPKTHESHLPQNIQFEHIFLPTQPPYSYKAVQLNQVPQSIQIHHVGYPKLYLPKHAEVTIPNPHLPVVIYAPSLDLNLLMQMLKQGILIKIFQATHFNFIVKLHPSLASWRHYISSFMKKELAKQSHVLFDDLSSLQELESVADILITDFGSVGGEFKLSTGKPVLYLKIPETYEGGADLKFRDDWADAHCSVEELVPTLEKVLANSQNFKNSQNLQKKVLSCHERGDEQAAKTLKMLLDQSLGFSISK